MDIRTTNNNKIHLNTLIVFFLFILPHTIFSIIPSNFNTLFLIIIAVLNSIFLLSNLNLLLRKIILIPFILTLSQIIFGLLNSLMHQSFSFYNLLAPLVCYAGYLFFLENKFDLKIFLFIFPILYIFYYFVYFSVLPDLFFRPGFDEDAIVFDNSSSNAIPITLNITLYIFIIFNKFYKLRYFKYILFFAFINLSLIVIQQSRGGILCAFLILLLSLYQFNKKYFYIASIVLFGIVSIVIIFNVGGIIDFMEVLGNLDGIVALKEDTRGLAQTEFFNKLSIFNVFFGYPPDTVYTITAEGDIKYTYNVFLDLWNRYSLFVLIFFVSVLNIRIFSFRKYEFAIIYFLPFFAYSMIESLFFPNFWDSTIFLLIFLKKNDVQYFNLNFCCKTPINSINYS